MRHIFLSQRYLPERGGSIEWLRQICKFWPEPYLVLTHNYGSASDAAAPSKLCVAERREDIQLENWGLFAKGSLAKYFRAWSLLRSSMVRFQCCQIYCMKLLPEAFPAALLKFLYPSARIIVFVHGEELLAYRSSRELTVCSSWIAKRVNRFVCNSENTKRLFLERYPAIPKNKIFVSHPGVEVEGYMKLEEEQRDLVRKRFDLPQDARVLVSLGRLTKRKNHQQVLRAMAELRDISNLQYLILGAGPEEDSLRKLAAELELSNQVHFMGSVPDAEKMEFLALSDLMIMPGIKVAEDIEGFGIALIEGQAAGLPVICGSSGGEAEAVSNLHSGILINAENLSELTEAIRAVLNDPKRYAKMREAAVQNAKKFDSKISVQRLYQELVGDKS